ncbi:hypothetical protein EV175_004421 [Coemansia sp. RSA 1933]|nr:hypothetical protein EV175_004421 [Coemansia sp. RSA 1933]
MEQGASLRRRRNRILPAGNGSARKSKQRHHHELPKPTSTRFANSRRILESHSDLELENADETDVSDDAMFTGMQPHSIYATEEEYGRASQKWKPRQEYGVVYQAAEGVPMLRGFFDSNFRDTWDIGMLAIVREWRRMAQDSQRRRNELLSMWMAAFKHRKQVLLSDVVGRWRVATRVVLADPRVQHQRVQRRMAEEHHRRGLLTMALDGMQHASELQRRLSEWTSMHNARTVADCLDAWRRRLAERKSATIRKTSAVVRGARCRRIATNALKQWRSRLAEKQQQQARPQKRRGRALTRDSHMALANRQPSGSYRRVIQGSEEAELDRFMENKASTQRKVLRAWRQFAHQLNELDDKADLFYNESLVFNAFDKCLETSGVVEQQKQWAAQFYQHHTARRALEQMRSVYRARRSNQVQAHALRDWERKHQEKRRRALFLAWHKVVIKDHGASEARADRMLARRNRATVAACLRHWRALCHPSSPARHVAGIAGLERHGAVEYVDAQTMTSMVGPTGLRSEGVQTSDRGDDTADHRTTLMLKQRVIAAEEAADQYRALAEESGEAAMALHARMRELGPNLDQFSNWINRRTMARFFNNARAAVQTPREQNAHPWDREKEAARVTILRQVFVSWKKLSRGFTELGARGDRWQCDRRRLPNAKLCFNVLRTWRRQLKLRTQMYKSAVVHDAYWTRRRALKTMFGLHGRIVEMNVVADKLDYTSTVAQVWLNLLTSMCRHDSATTQLLTDGEEQQQMMDFESDDGLTQDTEPEQFSWEALNHMSSGVQDATEFALTEEQDYDLLMYFIGWHQLVAKMREKQDQIIGWIPPILKDRVDRDGFEWDVVYYRNLLDRCVRILRGRVMVVPNKAKKRKTQHRRITELQVPSVPDQCDPERMADLERREKQFTAAQSERTAKHAIRMLKLESFGNLLEKFQEGQMTNRAVLQLMQHSKRMAKLRELERSFALKKALQRLRQWVFVQRTNSDNAQTIDNASLMHRCFRDWRGLLRRTGKNSKNEERALFMKAIAFRWEKQAQSALTRWMGACKSDVVRVAAAKHCTDASQRESLLAGVAQDMCNRRVTKAALDQLRRVARRRRLHEELRTLFASAWCNANTKRHVIKVWRARISPNSSMFFSVSDLSE